MVFSSWNFQEKENQITMWYLVCILIGLIIGYAVKDLISPEIVIKGKIKQKGRDNSIMFKKQSKGKKRRLFKRKK